MLSLSRQSRWWIGAAAVLVAVLALACAFLPRGLPLTACSDIITALLMFSTLLAFALNASSAGGRTRWFWILQAAGWALWLSDQGVWIAYDLVLRVPMSPMHPADILLFMAEVPMLAGILLRPHLQPNERSTRLGTLDFLLLLVWWIYLYIFFIISWQYIHPSRPAYDFNYDWLFGAESLVLISVSFVLLRQGSGRWKRFYAGYLTVVILNALAFYLLNYAIEIDTYFTGSWYDIPYAASFVAFSAVALSGRGLASSSQPSKDDTYAASMATLAMMAVLSLPVMAIIALFDQGIPAEVRHFRILVTLATMFAMAFLTYLKQHRLNHELKLSNTILEEASLTDPLTGVRNRRYFSLSIGADVSQALRSHADDPQTRTGDLIFYLIDADNFKEVNDYYGHEAGDLVLREMTRRISSSIRHSDVLVRWGGEEFLIISRYTDRRDAETLASRVLAAVASAPFQLSTGESIHRTCSIGWASFPWMLCDPNAIHYEDVLSIADRALSVAKRAGKNRAVGLAPGSGPIPLQQTGRVPVERYSVDASTIMGPA